jgi:hypothetical protein
MSKALFLTSSIKLDLTSFGVNTIEKNYYLLKHFPYLTNKQVIYNLDTFNNNLGCKNFINTLEKYCLEYKCEIEIVVLWETNNENEIKQFNSTPKIIKITPFNEPEKYELIYKLENKCLELSTSYLLTSE